MQDELIAFGGPEYCLLLGVLLFARSMDLLSTWIGTPNLRLEANPVMRRLGWKWGTAVNLIVCFGVARWPLVTVMFATTSLLVAAHNFQSAWLMRTMGESAFRDWLGDRMAEANRPLYVGCVVAQALFFGVLGAVLTFNAQDRLIPAGIGGGLVVYAAAYLVYTLLSYFRVHRYSMPRDLPRFPDL